MQKTIAKKILIFTFIFLIGIAGCGNHTKTPSFLFFRKLFAPTVVFVIPNAFIDANRERIYLIHDEENGIIPPEIDGYDTYQFNNDGIIKIKGYESWLMKDTIIKAYNEDKEELWIRRIGHQTGREVPTVSAYVVATTKEDRLRYFQNSNSDLRRLDVQIKENGIVY